MARPVGSKTQNNNKPWKEALLLAVNAKPKGNKEKNLRLIAEKCVASAVEGDMQAIREIADRLDGKPIQGIEAAITGDVTINLMQFSGKK